MTEISERQMQVLLQQLKGELHSVDQEQITQMRLHEESFVGWLLNTVKRIGAAIGAVIAAPFKLLAQILSGILTFFFG